MPSLPNFILALRNGYSDGSWRYYHNTKDGEGAVVTYNFMTSPLGEAWLGNPANGFVPYSASERAATEKALKAFSDVANVTFVKGASQAEEVMFGQFDIQGAGGYADYPMTDLADGSAYGTQTVYVQAKYSMAQDQYGYLTLLHEIGHALGLKHPHEESVNLTKAEDRWTNTVMSYNNANTGDFKLGPLDVMALQSIYGPAKKKTGSNTYTFGKDKVIWDGGGTDTISASAQTSKVYIDLNGGTWNWIGGKSGSIVDKNQVWIGHFTKIEKAYGGSGSDTILGNELGNVLKGGSGNDKLNGRAGADRLEGGSGNDILQGGAGKDTIFTGSGSDKIVYSSLSEMGTISSRDRIADFKPGDRFDFRKLDANLVAEGRQKAKFIGNFSGDHAFAADEVGSFYFNKVTDTLVFEANGDGVADYAITVSKLASMKASYFLV